MKKMFVAMAFAAIASLVFTGCDIEQNPTIRFNANGGYGNLPAPLVGGMEGPTDNRTRIIVTIPSAHGISRDGYAFSVWNTRSDGSGRNFRPGQQYPNLINSFTLYAIWDVVRHTITFDANGGVGTVPSPQSANVGASIIVPGSGDLSRNGFMFGGWNTNADGAGINSIPGTSFTPTGPNSGVRLYARWNSVGTFTVTFNANGGVGTVPTQSVAAGSAITLPHGGELSKQGFFFGGWKDGEGNHFNAGAAYVPPGNVTMYAVWDDGGVGFVPGMVLAAQLSWLQENAQSDGDYLVEISGNELIPPHTISLDGRSNVTITIRGIGDRRTVTPSTDGILFTVGSGVTLVLDNNVSLYGRAGNNNHLVRINNGGTLIMNARSRITGNANTAWNSTGGGVHVGNGGDFIMNGGEISGNSSSEGAGVFVASGGAFTMNGGEISTNASGSAGGGVFAAAATTGWGAQPAGTFVMNGGTIIGNRAGSNGGGVAGTFTMNGGTVTGNNAVGSGGGVFAGGEFTMNGGTIHGNVASGGNSSVGGGVGVGSGGTFTLVRGEIFGNGAAINGGGINVNGTFIMDGGTIFANGTAGSGGGVNIVGGTFTLRGGTISGNEAAANGGGVHYTNGDFVVISGAISGNRAENNGGGVFVGGGRTFVMDGGTISGNRASGNGGGVLVAPGTTFNMQGGGTISGNNSVGNGGGIHNAGTFRIQYGTVFGNVAAGNANTAGGVGAALFNTDAAIAQHVRFFGDAVTIFETFPAIYDGTIHGF